MILDREEGTIWSPLGIHYQLTPKISGLSLEWVTVRKTKRKPDGVEITELPSIDFRELEDEAANIFKGAIPHPQSFPVAADKIRNLGFMIRPYLVDFSAAEVYLDRGLLDRLEKVISLTKSQSDLYCRLISSRVSFVQEFIEENSRLHSFRLMTMEVMDDTI